MKNNKLSIDYIVLVSFLVDLSDVLISLVGAIVTGSVTMLSQTLEGISDLISSTFLLIGQKRSKLPPTKKHPYGYGRETFVWALLSGIVTLTVTATVSLYLGYKKFIEPEHVEHIGFALFALVFTSIRGELKKASNLFFFLCVSLL